MVPHGDDHDLVPQPPQRVDPAGDERTPGRTQGARPQVGDDDDAQPSLLLSCSENPELF
jgi:hypothetical protein